MTGKVDTTGMVLIKDSRFMMGSEGVLRDGDESPRHEVRVTDFFIDRTEFTNGDLQRVVQRYASKFDLYSIPCGRGRSSLIASGDNAADLWNEHKGEVDFQKTCGLEAKPSLAIKLVMSSF